MGTWLFIRQVIVRLLLLFPFMVGYFVLAHPWNIIAVCLLAIRTKLPDKTESFETNILVQFAVANMPKTPAAKEAYQTLRDAFILSEGKVDSTDTKFGPAKIWLDTIFDLLEYALVMALAFMIMSTEMHLRNGAI